MSSRRTNDIEALSERLGSLQINKEASTGEYKQTDTEMSVAQPVTAAAAVSENVQAGLPKSMVLDPGWFNGDWSKFEDWWRGIRLFLKSNRINGTDDRITAILARLRGGVAGIYTQKKLNELDKDKDTQDWDEFVKELKTMFSNKINGTDDRITAILARLRGGVAGIYTQKKLNELDKDKDTQDWDEFVKELKTMFSNKSKAADAEWKIETFKQGKRNTADFMIEFEALAMKADTDELHTIFLLKKNVQHNIIKTILGYPPIAMPETLKEWKVAITSVEQGYESTEGR